MYWCWILSMLVITHQIKYGIFKNFQLNYYIELMVFIYIKLIANL